MNLMPSLTMTATTYAGIYRDFHLPHTAWAGRVCGVHISYNNDTRSRLLASGNYELKEFLEEAAVEAALYLGMTRAIIR